MLAVVQQESRKLAYADLDHIARGIYGMCLSQQELLEQKLQNDASVAKAILTAHGAISFDDEQAEWVATNQFTKSATRLSLPQMFVGTQWLGQNTASKRPSPIVDELQRLMGGTVTIFQLEKSGRRGRPGDGQDDRRIGSQGRNRPPGENLRARTNRGPRAPNSELALPSLQTRPVRREGCCLYQYDLTV